MDSTPKLLIEEPEFQEARRGYDRDQVNDFLDRVADAVARLQHQLNEATERARAAESGAAAGYAAGASRTEDEIAEKMKRTLVLAQRTADAAIAEAKEEAHEHLSAAQAKADHLLQDAETTILRQRDEAQGALLRETRELQGLRDALVNDVAMLDHHLDEQRSRLRASMGEIQRLLDDPKNFATAPAPELSGVHVSERDPGHDQVPAGSLNGSTAVEPHARGPEEHPSEEPVVTTAGPEPVDELIDVAPSGGGVELQPAAAAPAEGLDEELDDLDPDTQPTEAMAVLDDSEDAFLAELRKAMTDEEPLGPRDDLPPSGNFDSDVSEKSWFGRRR